MVDLDVVKIGDRVRWYVIADRVSAVIYTDVPGRKFHFFARVLHPAGPPREVREGPESNDRRKRHADRAAKRFARELGRILTRSFRSGHFGSIVLVAEPEFLALMRGQLPPELKRVVDHEIPNHFEGSEEELRRQIMGAIEGTEREVSHRAMA